ncbi:MAG: phosphoenolpyruvate--protein phosphotransferase [Candidatus Makana argininalis]
MLSGISVSPGIAFGKALIITKEKIVLNKKKIKSYQIKQEIKKFYSGINKTSNQLKKIKNKKIKSIGKTKELIFNSYLMILEDIEFEKDILNMIKNNLISAEYAVNTVIKKQIKHIKSIKDKYLRERNFDIYDIGDRLIRNILNIKIIDIENINENSILISFDISPSEIVQFNKDKIKGFITDIGGKTSHTSIIARSLEIPAIVGTVNITKNVNNGDYIILDAINNKIYINPQLHIINKIKLIKFNYLIEKKKLYKIKNLSAITLDKHKVEICSNINNINDITKSKKYGSEGIGLYRSEFIFMDKNSIPNEAEQFNIYKKISKSINNKKKIIRTIDIGGDKQISYINFKKEENPFLGCRGIRISIINNKIIRSQLKSILKASAFGKLCIMFPMVIELEELRLLNKEIFLIKQTLRNKNILFDENIEIGVMIETPSSALISKYLSYEVDFLSIGTNDLTQYTLAVDRGNEIISYLYNPFSISMILLINKVIKNSHYSGKWVSMCGELAGDKNATKLLLGMGLDEFSMSSVSIPDIKNIIRTSSFFKSKKFLEKILTKSTKKDVNKLIYN